MTMLHYPIAQVAYAVPDPAEAALRHSKLYGSGPFFRADHVPVYDYVHRGKPGEFDHTTIFGQWGELMIEFFVQHNADQSHVHDLYPFGWDKPILHHVGLIVEEPEATIAEFTRQGFETAARFNVGQGSDIVFVDTRPLNGHMTEIYPNNEVIRAAYSLAREAASSAIDQSKITTIAFDAI